MRGYSGPDLAIDFGSTHTVAALRGRDGRAQPLMFDGSFLLPSAVLVGSAGRVSVGRDAERAARLEPSRFEPNPKRRVDDGTVLLGSQQVPVARLVAGVLRRVADEAARVAGGLPARIVLSHPAQWGARRRQLLVDAGAEAGLPAVSLVAEPVAAARYFTGVLGRSVPEGAALLVYDFGGGTFDTAVLQAAGAGWRVLASDGLPDVGGLDLDAAIVEHLGTTVGARSPDVWARLMHPADDAARRRNRMLWEDVRAAKEQLSRTSVATLLIPMLDLDVHVTRPEFEQLARPYLERTADVTAGALQRAGVRADQLAGVFLVGGSSRVPLVGTILHHRIGVAPTVIEQPELVVAMGSLDEPPAAVPPTAVPPTAGPPQAGPSPAGSPLPTPPDQESAPEPPRGLAERRRGIAAAAGLLALAVVAGIAAWINWPRGGSDPTDLASASPGAGHQEVAVDKTAWYGPLKITLGRLTYDQNRLTLETTVRNEGADPFSPDVTMTFTLDGVQTALDPTTFDPVAGGRTTRISYTARSVNVDASIADGLVTIGRGDEARATVPAGDKGELVAHEPRSVLPRPVKLALRDLVVTVRSCHLRGGFFDYNGQADAGYQALTCVVDAQYTGSAGAGHYFGTDNLVLAEPGGTETGSTTSVNEALYGPEVHRNVTPGFLVASPATGRYRLRLVDVHAGETRTPAMTRDLDLPL
ncbi:Hsp70 family protein [Cryptosporangium arvum]|uniref:Hsp70 family protein n=1 Tax=Cryptosporangium arvum TaxID=80871 RepID=UPI0004B82F1C|nr:Hsp70 family protein [Cryptosporangium arvum]